MRILDKKVVGCIGTGNMGRAIISCLSKSVSKDNILAFDVDKSKLETIKKDFDIKSTNTIRHLTDISDIILIAVKPDAVNSVLEEIRDNISNKIIISIAAGVSISSIKEILSSSQRIIRVMPNTPALIGEGMSVISPDKDVDEEALTIVEELFSFLGRVLVLPEKLMDAVTAISGCGPAYGFTLIQAMTDGGVKMGIPRDKALILSAQTILGSARMIIENEEEPIILRGRVTSPGGSTIEAVHVLEKHGFSGIIMDAIEASKEKTESLGGRGN